MEAREKFIKVGSDLGVAQCSLSLANIILVHCRYTETKSVPMETREKFTEVGDVLGAAPCLRILGNILGNISRMQDHDEKAISALKEAREKSTMIGYILGAAQCSRDLGSIIVAQECSKKPTLC